MLQTMIILCCSIVLLSIVAVNGKSSNAVQKFKTNDSTGWKKAAEMLEEYMDDSVDPCNDFFQFSCGKWLQNNPIPPYLPSIDPIVGLLLKVADDLQKIMANIDMKTATHAVKQGKIAWDMCVTKDPPSEGTRKEDLTKLYKLLNSYGGWPALAQTWDGPVGGTKLGSTEALVGALFGTYYAPTLFYATMMPDWEHPQKPALIITNGQYGISDESSIVEGMTAIANVVGLPVDKDRYHKQATAIIALEQKLMNAALADGSKPFFNILNPPPYNSFTVDMANKRWPNFNWTTLLINMAKDNAEPKQLLTSEYIIPYPKYFDDIQDVLKNTDDKTMQNFLIWKFIAVESEFVSTFRFLQNKIYMTQNNVAEPPPPFILCAATIGTSALGMAISIPFVKQWEKDHPGNSISELDHLVQNTANAFESMLQELEWLDSSSLAPAKAKVTNLARNVAYPSWMNNETALDEMYSDIDLQLTDDSFMVGNKLMRFSAWTTISKINTPTDRHTYMQGPITVNAWYQPWYNSITIPAAILQMPFFDGDLPKAVNYGAIGTIMGHELTHGFDNRGVEWDAYGEKKRWMDEKSYNGFLNMAECVVKQYDDVCFPDLDPTDHKTTKHTISDQCPTSDNYCKCVAGKTTEGENIADNGGTMAAYRGYQAFTTKNGSEPRLPGILSKYTMEQIFWISFGTNWCMNTTNLGLIGSLQGDNHSPDQVRAIETPKNNPGFAKAFNCPAGSAMAPKDHCYVWVHNPKPTTTPLSPTTTTPSRASIKTVSALMTAVFMIFLEFLLLQ